jgi:predicted DCC family thiol-disulfide oxidoreductase YuxK
MQPLFVYDADCGFCLAWIDYFQSVVNGAVQFVSYQNITDEIPEYTNDDFAKAVHLIEPDGSVSTGANATFKMFWLAGKKKHWYRLYRTIPGFAWISEWFYQFVARHRGGMYRLTRLLFGLPIRDPSYTLVQDIFIRGLGLVYLVAFISLGVQLPGLLGSDGILPVQKTLAAAVEQASGFAVWSLPTVFWLFASNAALFSALVLGILASCGIVTRTLERTSLCAAFILYLSFVTAGGAFFAYQWDMLLLEAGFLGILFSIFMPAVWALRALLFKLMMMSGLGKLAFGGGGWHELTALSSQFETQPLPTPLAWYMHQLPVWMHQMMTALTIGVEVFIPVLYAAPRRVRFIAAWVTIGFQAAIFLTGNYTFFNVLALVLALTLFDDRALRSVIPDRLVQTIEQYARHTSHYLMRGFVAVLVTILAIFSVTQGLLSGLLWPLKPIHSLVAPLKISNSYGLFISMTQHRPELIIQGSRDGEHWQRYNFAYKPDSPRDRPSFIAPHQPRLDWQMWFAALRAQARADNGKRAIPPPWLSNLVVRLRQGSDEVTQLFEQNPFPESPPQYVRVVRYEYSFSSSGSRRWWDGEKRGVYIPPVTLTDFQND